MRKFQLVMATLLLASVVPLGIAVEAQSPPHVFVGQATLDGAPAPDGTVIEALAGVEALAVAESVVHDGKFTLIVEQPEGAGAANARIGFAVGEHVAQQSEPWEMGQLTLLTLKASSALPAIPVEIYPPLPERLARGQEFLLAIKSDTGFHKATGGEVRASFDPEIFTATTPAEIPGIERTPQALVGPGVVRVNWSYPAPVSTAVQSGELVRIPMRVLDAAPSGPASLSVDVGLSGTNGRLFRMGPGRVSADVMVVSLAADFNSDDLVDVADLAALGAAWGKNQGEAGFQANFDLDGDGSIWIGDLAILLRGYKAAY